MRPPDSFISAERQQAGKQLEDGTLVKFQTYKAQTAEVFRAIPVPGTGLRVTRGRDGPRWDLEGVLAPLNVAADGTVTAATIGGTYPTIDGDSIADSPAPRLSGLSTGTKHVVVNVAMTLDVDGGTYVSGYTSVDEVTLTVEETDPGAAGLKSTDGNFAFVLATFVGGVKTAQNYAKALNLAVCDDGTATATGQLFPEEV